MLETEVAPEPARHASWTSPMSNAEKKVGLVLGSRSGASVPPLLVLVPKPLGEPSGQAQTKRRVGAHGVGPAADLPTVWKLRQPLPSDEDSPEANELLGAGAVWLGG